MSVCERELSLSSRRAVLPAVRRLCVSLCVLSRARSAPSMGPWVVHWACEESVDDAQAHSASSASFRVGEARKPARGGFGHFRQLSVPHTHLLVRRCCGPCGLRRERKQSQERLLRGPLVGLMQRERRLSPAAPLPESPSERQQTTSSLTSSQHRERLAGATTRSAGGQRGDRDGRVGRFVIFSSSLGTGR